MYILNEKEYIREILASGNKPDNISNGYLITLIAKYYFDRGKDPNILIDTVKAKMLDTKVIQSGCVSGADAYAMSIRKTNKPEQTVSVIDDNGLICLYDIQLD